MRIEWSPEARASARRHIDDQDGMYAISAAVATLAVDPSPFFSPNESWCSSSRTAT